MDIENTGAHQHHQRYQRYDIRAHASPGKHHSCQQQCDYSDELKTTAGLGECDFGKDECYLYVMGVAPGRPWEMMLLTRVVSESAWLSVKSRR